MLPFLVRQDECSIDDRRTQLERSWRSFRKRFRSEEQCVDAVYEELESRLICPECGGRHFDRASGARSAFCMRCGSKVWITSGTFLHRKKALRAWLAAIWLMESGVGVSAWFLHQKLKIAYSTAHEILRALSSIVEAHRCESARHLPSSLFLDLFNRRSRETPARVHPREEQSEAEAEAEKKSGELGAGAINFDSSLAVLPDRDLAPAPAPASEYENYQITPTGDSNLDAAEQAVFGALCQGPLSTDALAERLSIPAGTLMAAITMLELKGNARCVGNQRYEACKPERSESSLEQAYENQLWDGALELVEDIREFIRSTYMGISRKYLQSYLASHWCFRDRKRWGRSSLLRACVRWDAGGRRTDEAVTPLLVKVTV
ncbi:MAG: hypothetical protein KC777_22810 [Cyanobacteria bacterium HKST-UBA02]|nr:hypothetical protein [Cyanobacteria bacterium HKST-UBA02]